MLNASDYSKKYAEEYGMSLEKAAEECAKHWRLLGKVLYGDRMDLTVHKIGTFKRQKTAPKRFKHPTTGEITVRPEKSVIKFKESEFPYT